MFKNISYYIHRVKELGPQNLVLLLAHRFNKKRFNITYTAKAQANQVNHDWKSVVSNLNLNLNFESFIKNAKQNSIFDIIFNSEELNKYVLSRYKNYKAIQDFSISEWCWQKDFKALRRNKTHIILHNQWQEKSNIFYQDIKIDCPQQMRFNEYNPDVKVPWDQSRFNQIFDLGIQYQSYPNPQIPIFFQHQIESWITQNHYLLGINWVCTMDVAIRAINLIWGFYFFKDSSEISIIFWEKFFCSLYDHLHFIENNWEWSDKPNNHYLADLLGYFYLCIFFSSSNKLINSKKWCVKKLLEQFSKQILSDGTAYEGSTNYHKLDTEIFLHFKLLCNAINEPLPLRFIKTLDEMLNFVAVCQNPAGNLIQIGDNDSGKIVADLKIKEPEHNVIKTYANFGLTIIKDKPVFITFRHATFDKTQPTGHFHEDELSITLCINNLPILVDPGSYTYTANSSWRNLMRSYQSHNTFYPNQKTQFTELFQLKRSQCAPAKQSQINTNETIKIESSSPIATRKLEWNAKNRELKITDWAHSATPNKWNWIWIFAPEINLIKLNNNLWEIKREKILLAQLRTTHKFKLANAAYSAEYGKIEKSKKLVAQKNLSSYEQSIFTLNI